MEFLGGPGAPGGVPLGPQGGSHWDPMGGPLGTQGTLWRTRGVQNRIKDLAKYLVNNFLCSVGVLEPHISGFTAFLQRF